MAPPPSPTALGTEAEGTTSGSPIAPVAEDTAAEEDAQDDKPEDEEETEALARQEEQQGKDEVSACIRGPLLL